MALNPPLRDWAGKTVWLVGASSGIGQACADLLHAQGATVFVSARKASLLDAWVAAHPGADGQGRPRAVALPLDVTDRRALQLATDALAARGPLDLVVYCAGYYLPIDARDYRLDEMLRHEQVNYVGALYLLEAVLPHLKRQAAAGQDGHLSLVSSVAGFRGLPRSLAYGPTKAALINLAEALYLDLSVLGLGVSVVNPGFVETPLTAQNDFRMPALITPEVAAREMLAGWARGDFELHFPKRFTRWLKFMRLLPYRLYFPLIRKFTGL
ncbi:SDR family NAD(P)-dependent oxidoreductase [Rhodoferax sp. BAB1]|uniref:SDR family NAD(P)-dependent oxidoreductase n=1 Tax=Rhodoferax sp. BAB1 TaxID=2741720 RepID=UPI0015769454|nr:SDR family NAD(P)-dependent oxidoreductase [Rhodoferax sp. BAB1]QKO20959.1 SDR family NAD(P)-dependent oxidoreductase [Rhodoferax sp. BAB1]